MNLFPNSSDIGGQKVPINMETRDIEILDLVGLTGGASAAQIERLIDSSPRNTNKILARLQRDDHLQASGQLTKKKGGRPTKVYSSPIEPASSSAMHSLLLAEYAIEHPKLDYCSDPLSAQASFEAAGAKWGIPPTVEVLCIEGKPFRVLLPIDSEQLAVDLLHRHQSWFRWSLLPCYQLEVLTPTNLQEHVHAMSIKGIDLNDPFMLKKRPAKIWTNILRSNKPQMRRYHPFIEDAVKSKAKDPVFNLIPRVLPRKTMDCAIHAYPLHRARWSTVTKELVPQPSLWGP